MVMIVVPITRRILSRNRSPVGDQFGDLLPVGSAGWPVPPYRDAADGSYAGSLDWSSPVGGNS